MPEIRDFFTNNLIISEWGESGKVILKVSIAVFSGAVEKFSGKDGSAPSPRKKGPYAYESVKVSK